MGQRRCSVCGIGGEGGGWGIGGEGGRGGVGGEGGGERGEGKRETIGRPAETAASYTQRRQAFGSMAPKLPTLPASLFSKPVVAG